MSMVDAVVYPYIGRRKIQKFQKWRILVVSLSFRLAGVKNSNQASGLSTLSESIMTGLAQVAMGQVAVWMEFLKSVAR